MEIADNVIVLEEGCVVGQGQFKVLADRLGGKLRTLLDGELED